MRRFFQFLVIICILCSTVSLGATKNDVIAAISSSYDVCGTTFKLPSEIISKGTQFLNATTMTDEQYSKILGQINKAVSTVREIGTTDINKMTDEQKVSLMVICLEVIKIANIDMSQVRQNVDIDGAINQISQNANQNQTKPDDEVVPPNPVEPNEENTVTIPKTDITNDVKEQNSTNITNEEQEVFFQKTGNTLNTTQIFMILTLLVILVIAGLFIWAIKSNNLTIKNIIISFLTILIFVLMILIPISYIYIDNKPIVNFLTYVATNDLSQYINKEDKQQQITYGQKYGELEIKDLDIKLDIYYGDSEEILQRGIGQYIYSYLPGEGKGILYTTHNTKDKLYNLKDIKVDDKIQVHTIYGNYEYMVYDIQVVLETEKQKAKINTDKETLMIYTCYPFDNKMYTNQRLIIYCNLVEE